jgi:hypothetical protein
MVRQLPPWGLPMLMGLGISKELTISSPRVQPDPLPVPTLDTSFEEHYQSRPSSRLPESHPGIDKALIRPRITVFRPSTDRRSLDSIASPSVSKLRSLGTAILAQFEVVAFLSSCREAIEGVNC